MNGTNYRLVYLLIAVLVGLSSSVVRAQIAATPNEINTRLNELKEPEKNIPENQFVLSDELRRIDEELARHRAAQNLYERANLDLNQIKDSAGKLFQDVDALNCDAPSGADSQSLAASLFQIVSATYRLPQSAELNPWASIVVGGSEKPTPKELCQNLKNAIGDQTRRQGLLTFVDAKQKEFETNKNQVAALVEALQKRRAALLQRLSANTTQNELGNSLWAIILVIGLLSIGTILAIKLFAPELQVEWVTSGQVIQFVTVMILLSVIMALGLASILKENTLGTLLGGIAGYVLSQGVGRAAASAVTRGLALGGASQAVPTTATSISPNSGPAAGGTTATITGSGFMAGATVTFGGVPATTSSISSTSITVVTPAHTNGTVDIGVANSNGQSATLPQAFTYQ